MLLNSNSKWTKVAPMIVSWDSAMLPPFLSYFFTRSQGYLLLLSQTQVYSVFPTQIIIQISLIRNILKSATGLKLSLYTVINDFKKHILSNDFINTQLKLKEINVWLLVIIRKIIKKQTKLIHILTSFFENILNFSKVKLRMKYGNRVMDIVVRRCWEMI